MPRLDINNRRRVITLHKAGYSVDAIRKRLREEQIMVTTRSLFRLVKKYREHEILIDLPRRRRCKKLSGEMVAFINGELEKNDELTATKLREMLKEKWPTLQISINTIKRYRRQLGWVCTRPHYCQLIRDLNKRKRVAWCKEALRSKDKFTNMIFTDECTVQLEQHGRLCFRKEKQPRKLKQRPKHPAKLHIWGGISYQGATQIVMFQGTMDAVRYQLILERSLLPFIHSCYPEDHRLQQDNDPKHTSRHIERFFEDNGINWWRTPPESPDLNPIENVWGSLKQYLRTSYKPTNLTELQEGIARFWQSLTPSICQRYIKHLDRVIPKVISVDGDPTGY